MLGDTVNTDKPGTGLRILLRQYVARAELACLPLLPRPAGTESAHPSSALLSIYRNRNSSLVHAIVAEAEKAGIRIFLWALDQPVPSLADYTVGVGPGARGTLLVRLLKESRPAADEYIIISDDDLEFVVGDLSQLLRISGIAKFMIAQPTHLRDSKFSYAFTCGQPHLTARSTRFVECGPFLVIHPSFRDRAFQILEGLGMGWGSEVLWNRALRGDETFGIVDAVRIRHLGSIAAGYDATAEKQRLQKILAESGLADTKQICKTTGYWFRWRQAPSWHHHATDKSA